MTSALQRDLTQAAYYNEITILAQWAPMAEAAIRTHAKTGKEFTADTIRKALPADITPKHPNAWGGLFRSLRQQGIIETCGYHTSTTQSRNGGIQRVWRGTRQALA